MSSIQNQHLSITLMAQFHAIQKKYHGGQLKPTQAIPLLELGPEIGASEQPQRHKSKRSSQHLLEPVRRLGVGEHF